MRVIYRAQQFWKDIFPKRLSNEALIEIQKHLTAEEYALFDQYSRSDKQHVYEVLKLLQKHGHQEPHLLTAALLHDVGKARFRLSVWDRSWPVLIKKLSLQLFSRWGDSEPVGWKRPFVIIKQHATWGAEMAQKAGSHPRTVSLINRHQDKLDAISTEEDRLLSLLQWADDQN